MALVTKRDTCVLIQRLDLLNTIYNHDTAKSLCQKVHSRCTSGSIFDLKIVVAQGITTKDVAHPVLCGSHDMEKLVLPLPEVIIFPIILPGLNQHFLGACFSSGDL